MRAPLVLSAVIASAGALHLAPLRTPMRLRTQVTRLCDGAQPEPAAQPAANVAATEAEAPERAETVVATQPENAAAQPEPVVETVVVEFSSPFGDKSSPIWQKPKPVPQGPDTTPPALKLALDYLWVPFVLLGVLSQVL